MTPLEKVLSRLPGHKQTGDQWGAKCPSHDDKRASLSISVGSDGRVILYCHAKCSFEAVIAAIGLEAWELFPDGGVKVGGVGGRKIVAEYRYTDEKGRLIYQSVRYEPKDFRLRRPDGNGGWIWKMDGVERVLYRLPEVLKAIPENEIVCLVEGEKDADNLVALGFVATTNAEGAKKWNKSFTLDLKDGRIVIFPDNDAAGNDCAELRAAQLYGVSQSTRIVKLPNLPPKGDISDWIAAGGTKEELEKLINEAPIWKPPITPGEHGYKKNFEIEQIEKVLTKPPIYYVSIGASRIQMTIGDLMNFGKFSTLVAESTNQVPHMANHPVNWKPYINDCLANKLIETEAPEEAGEEAAIWHRILRYLELKSEEDETALGDKRGPYSNERLYYFHGLTMHQFLGSRGVRIEATKLWDVLRKHGATAVQKWVRNSEGLGKKINAWTIEKSMVASESGEEPNAETVNDE